MKDTFVALVTVLLDKDENRQECCREFVELKTIPKRGEQLNFRGCALSVESVIHRTIEPSLSEWSDLLESEKSDFDLELITAPVELGNNVAKLTGHPLMEGGCP